MAISREDENEAPPIEKKRRRPRPKPVDDEDSGGPGGGGPGGRKAPPEGEESEGSGISTGNILLDIVLDFRDDCVDWVKENKAKAIIVGAVLLLMFVVLLGFTVNYIVGVMNRPTLKIAVAAYDYGSYPEAKVFAEGVLKYAAPTAFVERAGAMFVLGAATCSMADFAWTPDRQPYYLAAANYLRESEKYGFLPKRKAEGFYLLGKCLYMSGELDQCREPLQRALETKSENTKAILWYLANSYFLDNSPNYNEAIRLVQQFRKEPTVTELEGYEADLLESMLLLQIGQENAAEQVFAKVPNFEQFKTMREFVSGQIAFFRARQLRERAIEIEQSRQAITSESADSPTEPSSPEPPQAGPSIEPIPQQPTESTSPAFPMPPVFPTPDPSAPQSENEELQRLLPTNPPQKGVSAIWDGSASIIQRVAQIQERLELPGFGPPGSATTTSNPSSNSTPSTVSTGIPSQDPPQVPAQTSVQTPPQPPKTRLLGKDDIIVLPPSDAPRQAMEPIEGDGTKTDSSTESADPRFGLAKSVRERAALKYKEAIEHFKAVADDFHFLSRWRRQAELLTGICYEEMGDDPKAQTTFATLIELSPLTPEAVAAQFYWAEIERRLGRSETAAAGYVRAFDGLRKVPNYANPWLPKSMILERSDEAFRQRLQMKEYKEALSLLKMLGGVMPETEILQHAAVVYAQWAEELQRQADASFLEQRIGLQNDARSKYRLAGDAYDRLASFNIDSRNYERILWQSAENYRLGKDYRKGISEYKKYMKVNTTERQPETLVYIGEMYIHLDGLDEAIEALEHCIADYPNHLLIPRARLDVSRAYAEKKEWDKAQKMLEQNLIDEFSPKAAIYRDSIYALGKLLYERGDYLMSITYFEDALKNHPNAVQAADAHYCLAQAFLKRSEERAKSLREVPLEATKRKLESDSLADQAAALEHLIKTEEMLAKRQDAVGLSEAEQLMLRNAIFGTGTIQIKLKQYEQAILTFDLAATRYMDRPESLDALLQIAIAYRMLGRPAEAVPVLNRAATQLGVLEKANLVAVPNTWKEQIQTQRSLAEMKE